MPRVIHFEIHAEDPRRAIEFYSAVFGWSFTRWEGDADYWLIETGDDEPGINGGLIHRQGEIDGESVTSYVCTIDVPSLDDFLARVEAQGGTTALPRMAVAGVGWLAYAKDPEGNLFGMMEADRNVS